MTDFFSATTAERRDILIPIRNLPQKDAWQQAALGVAAREWGWGWWLNDDEVWQVAADAVKLFSQKRKHCWFPASVRSSAGPIREWAELQRQRYDAGTLERWQISALEGIAHWAWDEDETWERHLAAYDQFSSREGHGAVPRTHVEGGVSIGQWVSSVRRAIERNELPEKRAKDIGVRPTWVARTPVGFEYNLVALDAYVLREGHACVPATHVEGLVRLGQWVNGQRNEYTAGILSSERIAALEGRPGWVWRKQVRRTPAQMAEDRALIEAPAE